MQAILIEQRVITDEN
jgi:hypothetical protein